MPKNKKVKSPPPPPPTKADYLLKLKIINLELSKARFQASKLEKTNEILREKFLDFEDFRADISSYLTGNLQDREDKLHEIDEETKTINKTRENEKKESAAKVKEIELAYKQNSVALRAEVAILRSKLDSLEEFRAQRDVFMGDLGQQEVDYKKNEKMRREGISKMLMQRIIDKENFIKEFDNRLQQLMDDFEKTNEVRIAGYSRKLIRENIALTTDLDKMIVKQMQLETDQKVIKGRYENLADKYYIDELNLKRLQKTCENQVDIIKKISTDYAKTKVLHFSLLTFKNSYEKLHDADVCNKNAIKKLSMKTKRYEDSISKIKIDNDKVSSILEKDEAKIYKLRYKIKELKEVVRIVIEKEKIILQSRKISQRERYYRVLNLCGTISEILEASAIFTEPSGIGLSSLRLKSAEFKSRDEIEELFIKEEEIKVIEKKVDLNIIPEERDIGPTTLIDAESGTPYVFSSSEEYIEMDEGGAGEAEDFGASSSESAQGVPEEEEEKPSVVTPKISEKSITTITETFVDYAEEGDIFNDYDEDEDAFQFVY